MIPRNPRLHTTQWTAVVLAAEGSERAITQLYQSYWYPLYAYTRRRGYSHHDAEDLAQKFFVNLLDRNDFKKLDRTKSHVRGFLFHALKNFLATEWRHGRRAKRQGAYPHVSIDLDDSEYRFANEPSMATASDVERYDWNWAVAVLEAAQRRLKSRYASSPEKAQRFEALQEFITDYSREIPRENLAEELGMERGALRVAIHRLRDAHTAALREEVIQTLMDPTEEEIDTEVRYLVRAMAKGCEAEREERVGD